MTPVTKFEELGLSQTLAKRLKEEIKVSKPTPVQAACIRPILMGKNCIAQAPTGSGKTMAFAIPMIEKWSKDPHGMFGLVLSPTRELAHQIKDQFKIIGGTSAKVCVITGGEDYLSQKLEFMNRPHFLIATPGRLEDLILSEGSRVTDSFRHLKFLVLDEADRMLHEQFESQLTAIKKILPRKKQTLFFSATIPDVEEMKASLATFSETKTEPFIYNYQDDGKNPTENTADESTTPLLLKQNISQKYIACPRDFKDGYMMELLRSIRDDNNPPNIRSMMIFATTCRECEVLSTLLNTMGFSNVSLHGNMSQKARNKALSDFKSSQASTLVATDVASRGLDIKTVDLVVNYAVPMPEDYVHRVGRAGRHTQKGLSIMFIVPPRDIQYLTNIENYIRDKLGEMKINERKVLEILTEVQAQRKLADIAIKAVNPFEERAKRKRKLEEGQE